jgi:Homeodomain-like domain
VDLRKFLEGEAQNSMESLKDSIGVMPLEKKRAKCVKWHQQGVSKKDLAEFFGVSTRQIYNWLNEENQSVIDEFEVKTGLELLVEQFRELGEYERLCMYEASHLGEDQISIDPATGEKRLKTTTKGGLDAKAKFIGLAMGFRKMQIDLLTQTGLIPKQPEKIHASVSQYKADDEVDAIDHAGRPELTQTIVQRLLSQQNL